MSAFTDAELAYLHGGVTCTDLVFGQVAALRVRLLLEPLSDRLDLAYSRLHPVEASLGARAQQCDPLDPEQVVAVEEPVAQRDSSYWLGNRACCGGVAQPPMFRVRLRPLHDGS